MGLLKHELLGPNPEISLADVEHKLSIYISNNFSDDKDGDPATGLVSYFSRQLCPELFNSWTLGCPSWPDSF